MCTVLDYKKKGLSCGVGLTTWPVGMYVQPADVPVLPTELIKSVRENQRDNLINYET